MTAEQYIAEVDKAYDLPSAAELENRLRELTAEAAGEYGADSAVYAAVRSELGSFYRGQARFAESEAELSAVLEILKNAVGENAPDYATALNNLAGTHRRMKKFDRAEAEFAEALEIYARTVGKRHMLYASGLNNLSLLCLDRNDLAGAAAYLSRSADILDGLPECQDELAASLCNLAVLDRKQGRPADGIARLERAIGLFEGPLGTDTPHYHAALLTLGLCRRDLGDFAGARSALAQAEKAARALYGEAHPEYRCIVQYLCETEEMERKNG